MMHRFRSGASGHRGGRVPAAGKPRSLVRLRWVPLAAAFALIAGCAGVVPPVPWADSPAVPTSHEGASQKGTPSPGTSASPTIPPELLECGDPKQKQKDGENSPIDLTEKKVADAADWSIPGGYFAADGYYDDLDYEQLKYMNTYVSDDPGFATLDLLGVLGYDGLDWGDKAKQCGEVPLDAMLKRVAEYRSLLGATALSKPKQVTVGGLPAVTQDMEIPEYNYRGYWVFSQSQLLFIGCQWTSDYAKDKILSACTNLVDSVTFN